MKSCLHRTKWNSSNSHIMNQEHHKKSLHCTTPIWNVDSEKGMKNHMALGAHNAHHFIPSWLLLCCPLTTPISSWNYFLSDPSIYKFNELFKFHIQNSSSYSEKKMHAMTMLLAFCVVMLKLVNALTNEPTTLNKTCFDDIGFHLEFGIYQESCPEAEAIISSWVEMAISQDPRMAASLLRLHFHDCFVNASPSNLTFIYIHTHCFCPFLCICKQRLTSLMWIPFAGLWCFSVAWWYWQSHWWKNCSTQLELIKRVWSDRCNKIWSWISLSWNCFMCWCSCNCC